VPHMGGSPFAPHSMCDHEPAAAAPAAATQGGLPPKLQPAAPPTSGPSGSKGCDNGVEGSSSSSKCDAANEGSRRSSSSELLEAITLAHPLSAKAMLSPAVIPGDTQQQQQQQPLGLRPLLPRPVTSPFAASAQHPLVCISRENSLSLSQGPEGPQKVRWYGGQFLGAVSRVTLKLTVGKP
jgi:hypothetical protein